MQILDKNGEVMLISKKNFIWKSKRSGKALEKVIVKEDNRNAEWPSDEF